MTWKYQRKLPRVIYFRVTWVKVGRRPRGNYVNKSTEFTKIS